MGEFDSLCVVRPLLGQMCRVLEPSMTHCVRVRSGMSPGPPGQGSWSQCVCVECVRAASHSLHKQPNGLPCSCPVGAEAVPNGASASRKDGSEPKACLVATDQKMYKLKYHRENGHIHCCKSARLLLASHLILVFLLKKKKLVLFKKDKIHPHPHKIYLLTKSCI